MIVRSNRSRRRGTILVLFALLVFALFAIAALVIDLGLVRMTQQQMQSVVETEAIEGLRGGPSAAQAVTSFRFSNNPGVVYQLGPDIDFTPGVGDANALQIMKAGTPFSPLPQLNLTNDVSGDLVSGTFALTSLTAAVDASTSSLTVASGQGFNAASFQIIVDSELMQVTNVMTTTNTTTFTVSRGSNGTTATSHSSGATVLLTDPSSEDGTYQRNDFTNTITGQNAFLARKRRTRNLQGVDRNSLDNVTGVSSSGNAVPFLFGRAALFADVPAASAAYSPRRDGITVRATALAAQVRAKTVGPAYPDLNLPGAAPFGLTQVAWRLGTTTLGDAASMTDTSMTVLDGSSFPPAPFRVLIDAETLLVTALDSTKTNWTVQRGSQNTTHQTGALVQMSAFAYNVYPQGEITLTLQQTTLAAPALPGDTTLTVGDVSSFPTTFPFAAVIEPGTSTGEIVLVNAVDTTKTTLMVQRGVFGTTAAAHPLGAPIQLYLGTTSAGQNVVQPGDTILSVAKGSNFPTTFAFAVIVDLGLSTEEILFVTNVDTTNPSSDQLTVQRGVLGTTAVQHQPSAPVQLYAGQMLRITSLSAIIGANDTSITVSSSSGFPTTPFTVPFTVRIDTDATKTELLTVTAVNGGTWTVQRGVQGTTPRSHSIVPVFLNATLTLGRRVDNLASFPQPTDISSPRPAILDSPTLSSFSLVPLFDNIPQGSTANQGMLVGFGQVSGQQVLVWNPTTNPTMNPTANLGQFTVQKQPGALIPQNASSVVTIPPNFFLDPQTGQTLSSTLLSGMLTALFGSHNSLPNSSLVPALVR